MFFSFDLVSQKETIHGGAALIDTRRARNARRAPTLALRPLGVTALGDPLMIRRFK